MRERAAQTESDTRRDFLCGSSILLASALPGSIRKTSPLRFGLIGCGTTGIRLAQAAMQTGQAHRPVLAALCDVSERAIVKAGRGLNSRVPGQIAVTSHSRFVGHKAHLDLVDQVELDFVIVATPVMHRLAIAEACLAASIACYAEQPLTTDLAALNQFSESLAQPAADKPLCLADRYPLVTRFQPMIREIRAGAIGPLKLVRSDFAARVNANRSISNPDPSQADLYAPALELELQNRVAIAGLLRRMTGRSWKHGSMIQEVLLADGSRESRMRLHAGQQVCISNAIASQTARSSFEKIVCEGESGICELHRGRLIDEHGNATRVASPARSSDRFSQLESFIANLRMAAPVSVHSEPAHSGYAPLASVNDLRTVLAASQVT